MEIEKLKYPVGRHQPKNEYSLIEVEACIKTIRLFPDRLKLTLATISETQLNTAYRPEGWTVKQVIHHIADSHMNAILRFKMALTENNPTIKPYDEAAFARLIDYELPIEPSLNIIESVHQKWIILISGMAPADFFKTYFHPKHQITFTLQQALATYDWHCRHHLAHVNLVLNHN
jgi:hypothetical protein